MSLLIAGIALGGSSMIAAEARVAVADDKAANDPARPLFAQHCQKCHAGTKPKGDFRLESLSQDFADKKNREQWLTVLEQLKTGDMPPKEKPRPPAQEVQAAGRTGSANGRERRRPPGAPRRAAWSCAG